MEFAIFLFPFFFFLTLCFPGTRPRQLCLSAGLPRTKNPSQKQEQRPVQANQTFSIVKVQRVFITALSSQQCEKQKRQGCRG